MAIAPVAAVVSSVLHAPANQPRSLPMAFLDSALAAAEIGDETALETAAASIDHLWPAGAKRIRQKASELRANIGARLEARRRATAAREKAAKRADGLDEPTAPSRPKYE